jgi:hypothetical protein
VGNRPRLKGNKMSFSKKIQSELDGLSSQIDTCISETGYERPWWHIYPLMEKERRLINILLVIEKFKRHYERIFHATDTRT